MIFAKRTRTPSCATLGIFEDQKGATEKKFLTNFPKARIILSMVKIIFKHWKTGKHLCEVGKVEHDNPQSDRLVLKTNEGKFVDIIKSTIIAKEIVL